MLDLIEIKSLVRFCDWHKDLPDENFDKQFHKNQLNNYARLLEVEEVKEFMNEIITDLLTNRKTIVNDFREEKVGDLYSYYEESQREHKLFLLKEEISEEIQKRDNYYLKGKERYRKLSDPTDFNNLINYMTEHYFIEFKCYFDYKEKLQYLLNFEEMLKYSIICNELFNRVDELLIKSRNDFEKLFISPTAYFNALNLLEKHDLIFKTNDKFIWKGTNKESGCTEKKLLVVLFIRLKDKNYLLKSTMTDIHRAINNSFQNITISKTAIFKILKEFNEEERKRNTTYYTFFSFIN